MPEFRVCLCGGMSGPTPREAFDDDMATFVESLPKGASLLFGGVATGLVGRVASVAAQQGARIEGALIAEEECDRHPDLSQSRLFKTYDERQTYMFESSSTIYFLPGGLGTFHELFDFLLRNKVRRQKGLLPPKQLILVDGNRFWNPVHQLLSGAEKRGFLAAEDLASLGTWEPIP